MKYTKYEEIRGSEEDMERLKSELPEDVMMDGEETIGNGHVKSFSEFKLPDVFGEYDDDDFEFDPDSDESRMNDIESAEYYGDMEEEDDFLSLMDLDLEDDIIDDDIDFMGESSIMTWNMYNEAYQGFRKDGTPFNYKNIETPKTPETYTKEEVRELLLDLYYSLRSNDGLDPDGWIEDKIGIGYSPEDEDEDEM